MPSQRAKKQVAVRIPLRQKAELEAEAANQGDTRSEYIRSILRDRHRADQLAERLTIREERIDQLEEQLARRSQVEEKVDVLATRVSESSTPEPPFPIRWWQWFRFRNDDEDEYEENENE
jgi:1,6-anhydro-N-acetylmuramate kinase